MSEDMNTKSLGEKLYDANVSVTGSGFRWSDLPAHAHASHERVALAFAASLSHDETANAAITDLRQRLQAAEEQEHRVCAGCGSSWSRADLDAAGKVSCCPERKMLTAKEWSVRAEAAEERAERLSLALGVRKTADALRLCLETNSHPDPALVEKVDACLAVLGHAPLSAALKTGA